MPDPFVPASFVVPTAFEGPGFHLEPLGPVHNERDHVAWMSSIDHVRSTPGMDAWAGEWPEPMSLEENLEDLVEHFREFEAREAFAYSILDGDEVIGCLYINPSDRHGVHVLSWVREDRAEMDPIVWRAVSDWLAAVWPFEAFFYAARD